ncbi:hypothetical protein EZS27_021332 [termite gut metagenome]|uniref:Fibronectin type-III domain-containing protein n=1 Tax=termite gut metagenome TaxID=433724 RepID=A0A5J4R870_9ZZZZ
MTWSDPNGSGVTEYDIYWSQNSLADVSPEALPSGVKTARIKNTWSSGTTKRTYQITDLISDGAYYIAVAAVNSSEKHRSGWSLLEGRTQAVLEATVDLIAVKDLKVTWNNSSASLTWSDPNNSGVYEYDIYWSRQSLEAISPENPPIGVNKVRIHNTWKLGTGRTYVIRDLEPNSDYSVGIVALNSFGNFRSEMNRTTGRTSVNQAPKRRGDENVRLSLKELVSELIDLDSYFYDPDGDALVYEAVSDDVNKVKVILNDTKLILTAFSGGECSVLVTAKDPYDKQISSLITTWSTSDKPDAVTLKVTWRPSLAELTWLDPNENGVSDYEIFWSQSSLTGISTENPPVNVHKVRVNNTWGSSVERNYVISNLKVSTPYSIGVVAVDRTSGRRSDIYIVSGRTSPVTASR